jgi:hypothetical protein
MGQISKTADGIFIPRELLADFEHVEIDSSRAHEILIRSPLQSRDLADLLTRIDQRREEIRKRRGVLEDSSRLIREDRESEER